MKKVLGGFSFGFDLDEIENVMNYLVKNFKEDEDFKMWIGRGDDRMNGLEVYSEKVMEDEKLFELIEMCDGEGDFDEMYEEEDGESDMDDDS